MTKKYFTQRQLIKFFADWYKLITLVVVALLSAYFSRQPLEHQGDLQRYLNSFTQWLPLTVLIWMAKVEVELKSDFSSRTEELRERLEGHISEKIDTLYREINENEQLLTQLWSRFLRLLDDDELDEALREILKHYSEVKVLNDAKVGDHAKRVINRAQVVLKRREFVVNFGAVTVYPEPFYRGENKEIIATNIGSISEGFLAGIQDKHSLIELNRRIIEREQDEGNENFRIRRIFILKQEDVTSELINLMQSFYDIGVKVKYLPLSRADVLARENSNDEISKLEDFTVFVAKNTSFPSYSGRLEDLQQPRRMIISSNPQVIEGLMGQFQALWMGAREFDGSIDQSIFS